ncbi:MAG TPA: hypothetical protein VLH61_09595 [Bacteroidales bacterium]|nr:hypothetical protein [Bacteroidales bacterium]
MKKNNGVKIIIKFLLFCFAVGCTQEMEMQKPEKPEPPFTVGEAKMWFDTHLQPFFQSQVKGVVKSGAAGTPALIPYFNWAKALTGYDDEWSVVELPWAYENGKVVFNREGQGAIDPENPVDTLQLVRLVMAKNLNTNDVYAFRMVVLPDPEYFEQDGNLQQNQYLAMQPDFSGMVLFYDVLGEFVVGYKYRKGAIVNKLVRPTGPGKKSEPVIRPKSSGWVYVQTCWWQLTFSGGQLIGVKFLDCSQGQYLFQSANGAGGGSGGGFTGDPFQPIGWDPGGGGPEPTTPPGKGEYVPSEGDVFFQRNFSKTMEPQVGYLCLFSAMAYVRRELCGRTFDPGEFILSYMQMFNRPEVFDQGASVSNVLPFLREHFNQVEHLVIYLTAIENGWVIITDIAESPGVSHAVVIVGYKQNGRLIFMDPAYGRLREGHPNIFNASFRFVAMGCL